jgi:hypothetical protein
MSYSFSVKCSTKAEALETVAAKLEEVVTGQSVHAVDKEQALAAATSFVNLLPERGDQDVVVNVNGSVSWDGTYPDSHVLRGASVSVNAYLMAREAA